MCTTSTSKTLYISPLYSHIYSISLCDLLLLTFALGLLRGPASTIVLVHQSPSKNSLAQEHGSVTPYTSAIVRLHGQMVFANEIATATTTCSSNRNSFRLMPDEICEELPVFFFSIVLTGLATIGVFRILLIAGNIPL